MEDELRNRLRNVDADLLLVTDDSGRVFAAAALERRTVPRGTSLLGAQRGPPRARSAARRADTRRTRACCEPRPATSRSPSYPLVQAGITLGSLVLGRRLDSAFIASARADVRRRRDADRGQHASSARAIARRRGPAVAAQLAARARRSAGGDRVACADEDYVVAPLILGETQQHEPVRLWMLQPLTARVAAFMRPLRTKFFFYGAFAVLVAAVGAAFVARTVLGPFQRFVALHALGRGGGSSGRGGFDASNEALEVRTLNESFNQLMDSLPANVASSRNARRSCRRRTSCSPTRSASARASSRRCARARRSSASRRSSRPSARSPAASRTTSTISSRSSPATRSSR